MFGELIGLWCGGGLAADGPAPAAVQSDRAWPGPRHPDARCAARRTAVPGFLEAADVVLVETNPVLRALQRQTLGAPRRAAAVAWRGDATHVPPGPTIVIGNEFLDALPIQQLVRSGTAGSERSVALDAGGRAGLRAFTTAVRRCRCRTHMSRPPRAMSSSVARRWPRSFAARPAGQGRPAGRAVHRLRARRVCHRRYAAGRSTPCATSILTSPGEADLTAQVDFASFGRQGAALRAWPPTAPSPRPNSWARLGIVERASRLMAANPAKAAEIEAGVDAPDGAERHGQALQGDRHSLARLAAAAGACCDGQRLLASIMGCRGWSVVPKARQSACRESGRSPHVGRSPMPNPITADCLAELRGIAHGFFTREGGVSEGHLRQPQLRRRLQRRPRSRRREPARVARHLGATAERLLTCYQVHSADAVVVERALDLRDDAEGRCAGDQHARHRSRRAGCRLRAGAVCRSAGARHRRRHMPAGRAPSAACWKRPLQPWKRLGARRDRIRAALGPCIGPHAYQVGPEFEAEFPRADEPTCAFLPASGGGCAAALRSAGVRAGAAGSGRARYDRELYGVHLHGRGAPFQLPPNNHRREADYGRQISAIVLL